MCSTFEGNTVCENSASGIVIFSDSSKCVVSDNNIHSNGGYGIEVLSTQNNISNNIIKNCNDGIYVNESKNIVNSNSVVGATGNGVYLSGSSSHNIISNNLLTGNRGNGLVLATGAEKNLVTSNNLSENTGSSFVDNGTGTVDANNIT